MKVASILIVIAIAVSGVVSDDHGRDNDHGRKSPSPSSKNVLLVEPPLNSYQVSEKPSPAEILNNQKSDFEGLGYYKIKIDEPNFSKIVKADKCKRAMKSLGVCQLYRFKVDKAAQNIFIKFPTRNSKTQKGIKQVTVDLKLRNGKVETVQTDEDCNNLRVDLEDCITKNVKP